MTFRSLIILLVVVAAAAAGVIPLFAQALAAKEDSPAPQRSMTAMPVEVMPAVATTSYQVQTGYTGTLVAARRSELAFERPGKILRILVDEGDRVTAGQPLAQLDRRRLSASRMQVAAELAEAQAVLAELVKGPREESIATAAAELRTFAAERDVAERNLRRRRDLVETAAISREEYDESYYAKRAADARVDAAKKRLEELETGTRVERIDAQQARVDALAARLADVDHELEDTILTAPFDGAVSRRHLDEGAIVMAGDSVVDLIEDSRLEAWVGVPPRLASALSVGDTVSVRLNQQELTASVQSLRAELDMATRTQNVVLALAPSAGERLVAGEVIRLLLSETIQRDGFWAPTSALTPYRRGLWAVYVAEGSGPTRTVATRDVELLHTEGGRSYIRGALQAGEEIIVAGGHRVVAGQQVAVAQSP